MRKTPLYRRGKGGGAGEGRGEIGGGRGGGTECVKNVGKHLDRISRFGNLLWLKGLIPAIPTVE